MRVAKRKTDSINIRVGTLQFVVPGSFIPTTRKTFAVYRSVKAADDKGSLVETGGWSIAHVPSGYTIALGLPTRRYAIKVGRLAWPHFGPGIVKPDGPRAVPNYVAGWLSFICTNHPPEIPAPQLPEPVQ